MQKLKVFSGCTEFGSEVQAFRDRGHKVTTLGMEGDVDIIKDIRQFRTDEQYDFMTFHPPCTCFSVAAVRHHWKDGIPQPETLEAIKIVKACIRIINEARPSYWMIENPRGKLRSLDFMRSLGRKYFLSTVTYCQYGDTAQKPTDLWHNIPTFHPLACCKPGAKCHAPSPRGSHTAGSTQHKHTKEAAKVPYKLSMAICKAIEAAV
jgi:hypothetical protein